MGSAESASVVDAREIAPAAASPSRNCDPLKGFCLSEDPWEVERAALRDVARASAAHRDAKRRFDQAQQRGRPQAEVRQLMKEAEEAEEAFWECNAAWLKLSKETRDMLGRRPERPPRLGCDGRPAVLGQVKNINNPNGVLFVPPECLSSHEKRPPHYGTEMSDFGSGLTGGLQRGDKTRNSHLPTNFGIAPQLVVQMQRPRMEKENLTQWPHGKPTPAAPSPRSKMWPAAWATPAELRAGPTHWWESTVCGGRWVAGPLRR
eukprot:TRINITY_DN22901_c0_g1_i1.p1 TRINITY_DN22901_c0_g1~~TRINITY_DN22901_c0_g1_i1.p1  ORF type:complete len:262 (+),score=52.50 TRINITY_DN22901_c0_g1_i1:84-869(+)